MTKEVTIIARVQLDLDDPLTRAEFEQELANNLRNSSRWTLSYRPDAVEVLSIDVSKDNGRLAKHIELRSLLASQRQVAVFWEIDDVLVLRPDLTDDQAWMVLQRAEQEHDAEIGLNWHSLAVAATAIFGPEADPLESNA